MAGPNIWLHRYAVLVAVCILILVFLGGLVTSTDSGLAVPDWPLSYGQVFPPMVGGILYEHGHRLAAASVGLLTIVLAVWLWRKETRKWVRNLGAVALLAVICQGLLGGITVLFLLPTAVSVSHAGLAQIFLCLGVSIAVFTSRSWREEKPRLEDTAGVSLKTLTAVTTVVIYVQTLLGALMRHTSSGLAIPDWPLSFGHIIPPEFTRPILFNFAHRTWALMVAFFILWTALRVLLKHGSEKRVSRPALVLLYTLVLQVFLGAETVWSGRAVVITTLHVACGAFALASSLFLTLFVHRIVISRTAARPVTLESRDAVAR